MHNSPPKIAYLLKISSLIVRAIKREQPRLEIWDDELNAN